ncbi:MAG TPA: hypothetical protein VGL83_15935 [Stellaceae bacterium]
MRAFKALLAAGMAGGLWGCQLLGPDSISLGRDRYNTIIQTTSMEQTMGNIVRVYQHEPPQFMDVTEVDAVLSAGGSLTASAANIGATGLRTSTSVTNGRTGTAGGTIQYSETPTIRYVPLLGQALVAQLVTPVSVDAMGLLYDSSWPTAPLLDFASAYLTLDYDEFYSAFNTLIELDANDAIELAAARSDLLEGGEAANTTKTPSTAGAGGKTAPAGKSDSGTENNALVIYLRPFHPHAVAGKRMDSDVTEKGGKRAEGADLSEKQRVLQLWIRLLRLYADTQPSFTAPRECTSLGLVGMNPAQLKAWGMGIADKGDAALDAARRCIPTQIELRVVPVPRMLASGQNPAESAAIRNLVSRAPLMRTYSALGILKAAMERPHPKVELVTPERGREIRAHPWNRDADSLSYYTLLPSDEDSVDCPAAIAQDGGCDNPAPGDINAGNWKIINETLACWIANSATDPAGACATPSAPSAATPDHDLYSYEPAGADPLSDPYVQYNIRLGALRRYLLIVVADRLPAEAPYISYFSQGRWYYIPADDPVSQRNFHLLSLFLTMMAIAPSTQPLSPVINVGG